MNRMFIGSLINECLAGDVVDNGANLKQVVLNKLPEFLYRNNVTLTHITEDDIVDYFKTKATKIEWNSPEDHVKDVPAQFITFPGTYFQMTQDVWRPILHTSDELDSYVDYMERKGTDPLLRFATVSDFNRKLREVYGRAYLNCVEKTSIKLGGWSNITNLLNTESMLNLVYAYLLPKSIFVDKRNIYNVNGNVRGRTPIPADSYYKDGLYCELDNHFWVYLCKDVDELNEYYELTKDFLIINMEV